MNKNKKWLTRFMFVILLLLAGGAVLADSSTSYQPGSAEDPLVTKGYVDQLIEAKLKELSKTLPASQPAPAPTPQPQSNLQTPGAESVMNTEMLKPGDRIIGFSGTEFIVRTGIIKAIAGEKGDGLPNLTAGKDIAGGQDVARNHLIIIPRTDGRGLLVASNSGDAWIIIKGQYQVIRK